MHLRQDEVQLHEEVRVHRARCVEARPAAAGPPRASGRRAVDATVFKCVSAAALCTLSLL